MTLPFNPVTVDTIVLKDELKYKGKILLTYRIEYPRFSSSGYRISVAMVNAFYKRKALRFKRRCENELFKMAVEQYKNDVENNYPIRVFDALLVYKITYLEKCIISLYSDTYEYTGGAHGNTIRDSQTWNLQKAGLIRLDQLVRCRPDYKTYILKMIEAQIKKDPSLYFENYKELIYKTFNKESFYCTKKGIVVYYQQYDIAPYSSGIRQFLIPYSQCVFNPETMCFQ